jgi:hypothetical protein
MFRFLSLVLILLTVAWWLTLRWRAARQRQPRWPSWLVRWGLALAVVWLAVIGQVVWLLWH